MTAVEWLVWGALLCLVFWLYQAIDLARFLRRKPARPHVPHVPHWARHCHLPPHTSKHGRHARR